MSSRSSVAVGITVAVLIIAAVGTLGYYQVFVAGGSTSTATSQTANTVFCPSSKCVNVTMPNGVSTPPTGYTSGAKTQYGFSPDIITVVIGKNNTVFWTNDDVAPHTATSDTSGVFDSGTMNQGATFQWTFTTPGTFTYHCSFHAWMQGTVIVKSA